MTNAGSALMGIGRASGDDRAVEAARQAIESPLLEVSIDGARGILFNVIGGNDMAMHEINAAAETITAAADPEANIIFGATINPDLDGEVIVTVVATGFDASYFNSRKQMHHGVSPTQKKADVDDSEEKMEDLPNSSVEEVEESHIADIDMDLEKPKDNDPSDFHDNSPAPNIWAMDEHENELDKPSFLRRFRRKNKTDHSPTDENDQKEL